MSTVYVITSGESEDYGYVIDSVLPSKEVALSRCKKLFKESFSKKDERGFVRRFDLNVECWTVGKETVPSFNMPCWEVEYRYRAFGLPVIEESVTVRETFLNITSEEEVRMDVSGASLRVRGRDKNECLRILTSLFE